MPEEFSKEVIHYLIIVSATLLFINVYGLSAQYLLLKNIVIHKYMLYCCVSSLVILMLWKYALIGN